MEWVTCNSRVLRRLPSNKSVLPTPTADIDSVFLSQFFIGISVEFSEELEHLIRNVTITDGALIDLFADGCGNVIAAHAEKLVDVLNSFQVLQEFLKNDNLDLFG